MNFNITVKTNLIVTISVYFILATKSSVNQEMLLNQNQFRILIFFHKKHLLPAFQINCATYNEIPVYGFLGILKENWP